MQKGDDQERTSGNVPHSQHLLRLGINVANFQQRSKQHHLLFSLFDDLLHNYWVPHSEVLQVRSNSLPVSPSTVLLPGPTAANRPAVCVVEKDAVLAQRDRGRASVFSTLFVAELNNTPHIGAVSSKPRVRSRHAPAPSTPHKLVLEAFAKLVAFFSCTPAISTIIGAARNESRMLLHHKRLLLSSCELHRYRYLEAARMHE